jgi:adhesin transport system membrane fusion protein
MATLPFVGPAIKHRQPMTGARMIIVASAALFAIFIIWASLARVDEVTRGEGKVIPSSKMQVITAADAATVSEILVRSGQRVHKGQLLARLDSPENASQLGQLEAENQSLQARVSRLTAEGMGGSVACSGADCAGEAALRNARESALRSKVLALQATADRRAARRARPRRRSRACRGASRSPRSRWR